MRLQRLVSRHPDGDGAEQLALIKDWSAEVGTGQRGRLVAVHRDGIRRAAV